MSDPGNFMLHVRVNVTIHLDALADIGAGVSVLQYSLYKSLGLGNPHPCHSNLTMADKTQTKAMGKVSNTRIQIGYQAYLADCLFLDIPVIKQLPLFLGRPFHRACGAMIDMGCGTMTIDDGRDKGGSPKYGRVAPLFLDNEDEMARALAMEEALHESRRKLEVKRKSEKSPGTNPIQIDPQVKPDDRLVAPPERLESVVHKNQSRPNEYGCEDALLNMINIEYMDEDRDVFLDRSWEHVFSNGEKVYREWFLEFYSTMLVINDKGFNYDTYWNRIGQPTTVKKKLVDIRYLLLHIMHTILVGAFTHRSSSRDKVQKFNLWLLSLLDEGNNANVAWILAEYHSKKSSEYKRESEICGGHFVTKIYNDRELDKCSKPINSESWDDKMFRKALDRRAKKLSPITPLEAPPQASNLSGGEPSLMLMRNGYMLEHSMSILHHLADEANSAYLTYELLNIPPYPYPYMPYPHPYTHYLDMGNPSYEGCQYGAPGDAYLFTGARPSYGGNSIILRSGYEIRGSSRGVQDDDDKSDQFIRLEDCVESYDDMDD
uniref:Reverse transcriptase domain-containing protein n=1 Tax=Tanacetum cinerariifolium TaxID=118510 RepID=A0A699HYL7_TANCI|nr:hypothetical protein [Tanacetum cinerariifolium]